VTVAARPAVAMLLAAITMVACAAPSRRLTPRVVEDPIVLPRRMASVGLRGFAAHYEPTDVRRNNLLLGFRYAFTDRLEWVDLLSLRYALLDDRPMDGRPARPISLAVRAGATGIGYSSFNGLIVLPVASVDALRHIADRWALELSVHWLAMWQQRNTSVFPSPPYTSTLGYAGNTASSLTFRGRATRQLAERVALGASASVTQTAGCLSPTCAWVSRGGVAALTVSVRPWHWLTLAAGPYVGYRYRSDGALVPPANPTAPVVIPLRRVEWVGLEAFVTFYW
jgi:hypothetical protein